MDQVSNIGQETPFGHGPGADITSLSKVELVDVHRDLDEVPGGIGHLPENTMAAFYPKRDFAYGGKVYVTVLYDSAELWRSMFNVRPLPTFIQGFVADHYLQPLGGIEVKISETKQVVGEGEIALKRLDIIGVAVVPEDAREILARCAAGEIGLREMVGELGADR